MSSSSAAASRTCSAALRRPCPTGPSPACAGRFFGADAGVAADRVQGGHRHVKARPCRHIPGAGTRWGVLLLRPRSMLTRPGSGRCRGSVHHRIAHVQLGEILDQGRRRSPALASPAAFRGARWRRARLGDELPCLFPPEETARQRATPMAARCARLPGGQVVHHGRG